MNCILCDIKLSEYETVTEVHDGYLCELCGDKFYASNYHDVDVWIREEEKRTGWEIF